MASDSRVGDVLASKYRLEELLGSGGMGHVYKAVNEHVGRPVAIKLLRAEHAQNKQVVERFLREARAANLVRHPHVVDVVDIGQDEKGNPFIVQELLDGEDLAHFAERQGGKLQTEWVLDMLMPVIDAVAHAHARGVVHRDIKPENVFLANGPRGRIPKLLDFGISKIRAPDLRATEVGVMMGTPAYMAPEQVQGARDADPRSDVWALGVMLFELIAGRLPFDAVDAPALFVAIATKDAPTLLDVGANVAPEISRIVARCLRRRPDDRYPSAAELSRDLNHMMDGTELEPTGKRSIPPALMALVPDLAMPAPKAIAESAALAKTVSREGAPAAAGEETRRGHAGPDDAPARAGQGAGQGEEKTARAPVAEIAPPPKPAEPPPEAPSLAPPPPRVQGPRSAPKQPARASDPDLAEQPRSRLAPDASLPGVVLAPGASAPTRKATRGDWGVAPREERADFTFLVGLGVVGLVVILGIGLLMQVAHRPEGWPLAKFIATTPPAPLEIAIHGGLALVALAIGITASRRAHRHWRGELGGGIPNAILNGLFASAAFFSAIELLSAVS